jgi:hypothetical protein
LNARATRSLGGSSTINALANRSECFNHGGPTSAESPASAFGIDDKGYVLDDFSAVLAPDQWARRAIALLRERIGNGGDMVENTLRTVDPNIEFRGMGFTR